MNIIITGGVGTGSTELSAFDDALFSAGVSNYNLLYLSSVIPPGSTIIEQEKYETPKEDFGKRLYVVTAEQRSSTPGEHIAAGIGWYQLEGGGFVEHELKGDFSILGEIKNMIEKTIMEMCERRGLLYEPARHKQKVFSSVSQNSSACVIVMAVLNQLIGKKWTKYSI